MIIETYTLNEYLSVEIYKGEKFSKLKLIKDRFLNPSFDAIYLLRSYMVWSEQNRHMIIRNIYRRKLIFKYGIFISSKTRIDIGLKLPHPQGIVFGDFVKIGKNATIYQQVTFGGKNLGDAHSKNYPVVGENCIFFAGSKILGSINVADNSIIGANAVLIDNTVQDAVYVGIPARKTCQSGGREV